MSKGEISAGHSERLTWENLHPINLIFDAVGTARKIAKRMSPERTATIEAEERKEAYPIVMDEIARLEQACYQKLKKDRQDMYDYGKFFREPAYSHLRAMLTDAFKDMRQKAEQHYLGRSSNP